MKKWKKISLYVALGLSVFYASLSYIVYDRLSYLKGGDGIFAGNIPTDFTVRDEKWGYNDITGYQMPGYEAVTFNSRESGIRIAGWFVGSRRENMPVIILVHGKEESKASHKVLIPAGMLHRAGFNVMLIDLRDHGHSTVEDGRLGVGSDEYLDVLGAVDWLNGRGFSKNQIGLYGVSFGASVAIIVAGEEEGLNAIFADSGFADAKQVIDEELARNHYPTILSIGAICWAKILTGDNLLKFSPINQLPKLKGKNLFITHGSEDQWVYPRHGKDLYEAAQKIGVKSRGWFLAGVDHLEALPTFPKEYERKLVNFFRESLIDTD